MAKMTFPANTSNLASKGQPAPGSSPRKTPTAIQAFSQYREAKSPTDHSGRTSSGKAMPIAKAGRGTTTT